MNPQDILIHQYTNESPMIHQDVYIVKIVIEFKSFHCWSGSPLSTIPVLLGMCGIYEKLTSIACVNKSKIISSV